MQIPFVATPSPPWHTGAMTVRLTGRLICASAADLEHVRALLPRHVELTRAEPGCVSFEVTATDDPMVWQVDEEFTDPQAFAAHQARVADSAWGRGTAHIERRYTIDGLESPPSA